MNKLVILLTDKGTTSASELLESLRSAGISVSLKDLADLPPKATPAFGNDSGPMPSRPLAVLYEVAPEADLDRLRLVVRQAMIWPSASIVACRRDSDCSVSRKVPTPDNEALKRLGFDLVAESAAQLPALLRQVEDAVGTGELKLPEGFKSTPDSHAFSLPGPVGKRQLCGAFALLASLHLASNQKEAAQAALAGIARLVTADRWTIFLTNQTTSGHEVKLEALAGRSFSGGGPLSFDEEWRRELLDLVEPPKTAASRAGYDAAARIIAIRKTEDGNRVIAVPLVNGERVLGVLEGIRLKARALSFSQTEAAFLTALTIPIAASLSNSVRIAEAEQSSLTDDLTKLHNARYLRQFLVNEIKRARRYGAKVAALFLDLDDFKRVNDIHGHLAGSHALMEIAGVILPSVRDTDCVVRYGGDEFVVILPDTGVEEAVQVAERIRTKIERHEFTGGRRLKVALTASLGIAVFPQHALSPRQLIVSADRAMYQAKAAHKNCVRIVVESDTADLNGTAESHPVLQPAQFQRIPGQKLIS
jgi:diguanylate cyclase (GGDEF)-like protein